jgi:hypothetical protein
MPILAGQQGRSRRMPQQSDIVRRDSRKLLFCCGAIYEIHRIPPLAEEAGLYF